MSDVIHHARPTATQAIAAGQHTRFRADISAAALANKFRPVIVAKAEPSADDLAFGPVAHPGLRDVRPSIREIQNAVCKHFDILHVEMISDRRTAALMLPRHIAMWLCRKLTTNSLPALGRHFGGRDHSTCLHAVQKIEDKRLIDTELDEKLKAFIAALS